MAATSPGANRIRERNSKGQEPGRGAGHATAIVQSALSQETLPSSSVIYLTLASTRCVFIASVECFDRSLWTKLKAARDQPRVSLLLIVRLARAIRKEGGMGGSAGDRRAMADSVSFSHGSFANEMIDARRSHLREKCSCDFFILTVNKCFRRLNGA